MDKQTQALEQLVLQISQEAVSVSDIAALVRTKFTKLVDDVKSLFSKADIQEEVKQSLMDKKKSAEYQKVCLQKSSQLQWGNLEHIVVEVPEGFDGEFLKYGLTLEAATDYILRSQKDILEPFYVYVSTLVSRAQARSSQKDLRFSYKDNTRDRELITKELGEYFARGTNSRQKLIKVVRRASDLPSIFKTKNEIGQHIDTYDLEGVKVLVGKIGQMLDYITVMADDDKLGEISPETVNSLAAGTYEIAKQVEFISLVIYSSITYRNCIGLLEEKIAKDIVL